jgi:hypothetical protein
MQNFKFYLSRSLRSKTRWMADLWSYPSVSFRIHSISMERQSLLSRWLCITTCSWTEYQQRYMDRCADKISFKRHQPELDRWLWCKVIWKVATGLFFEMAFSPRYDLFANLFLKMFLVQNTRSIISCLTKWLLW